MALNACSLEELLSSKEIFVTTKRLQDPNADDYLRTLLTCDQCTELFMSTPTLDFHRRIFHGSPPAPRPAPTPAAPAPSDMATLYPILWATCHRPLTPPTPIDLSAPKETRDETDPNADDDDSYSPQLRGPQLCDLCPAVSFGSTAIREFHMCVCHGITSPLFPHVDRVPDPSQPPDRSRRPLKKRSI